MDLPFRVIAMDNNVMQCDGLAFHLTVAIVIDSIATRVDVYIYCNQQDIKCPPLISKSIMKQKLKRKRHLTNAGLIKVVERIRRF